MASAARFKPISRAELVQAKASTTSKQSPRDAVGFAMQTRCSTTPPTNSIGVQRADPSSLETAQQEPAAHSLLSLQSLKNRQYFTPALPQSGSSGVVSVMQKLPVGQPEPQKSQVLRAWAVEETVSRKKTGKVPRSINLTSVFILMVPTSLRQPCTAGEFPRCIGVPVNFIYPYL
jgi:hypothetical protein